MTHPLHRRYLPEIHDLHPSMAGALEDLVALFPVEAQDKIAFSIVPDWMGQESLAVASDFAARLRALKGTQVLHGLTHSLGPDFLNWLLYGHDTARNSQGFPARKIRSGCRRGWRFGRRRSAVRRAGSARRAGSKTRILSLPWPPLAFAVA